MDIHPDGYMIPPRFAILEVKANEKIPYWITEMIASHNIKLIRVSKYCQALESAGIFPAVIRQFDSLMNEYSS